VKTPEEANLEDLQNLNKFLNMIRSLYNIDLHALPELTLDEYGTEYTGKSYWEEFRWNPPRFFINTDFRTQKAIWREVKKRQRP